jgi:hypothetical protein
LSSASTCPRGHRFAHIRPLLPGRRLGFGGEWAAEAVLMGKVIRDKYRGRGVGLVQTGWAIGCGASALVYTRRSLLKADAPLLSNLPHCKWVRQRPNHPALRYHGS